MSLFSRLDRVRTREREREEQEESLFSVPDLGPSAPNRAAREGEMLSQSAPEMSVSQPDVANEIVAESVVDEAATTRPVAEIEPETSSVFASSAPDVSVSPQLANVSSTNDSAPVKPLSPLQRLQRRALGGDESEEAPERPSMFGNGETAAPLMNMDATETFASTPVQLPPREAVAISEEIVEIPDAPVEVESANEDVVVSHALVVDEEETTFPISSTNEDVNDAAETEVETVEVAPIEAAKSVLAADATPSRSPFDRLMTEHASASAPAAPPISSTNAPAPMSLAERLAMREATRDQNQNQGEAPETRPRPNAPVPLSQKFSATARAMKQDDAPASHTTPLDESPAAQTPVPVAASIETESPADNPTELPVPQPSQPTPTPSRALGDRFAAREILDRDLQMPASASASRDLAATGGDLARVEEDAALSEREAKMRLLFRHKHLMFDSVLGSIDPRFLQNPSRDTLRPALEKAVDGAMREFNLDLDAADRTWMIDEFWRETTDLGPLVPLLEDPGVNKIIVSGAADVAIEKLGRIERTGISFRDDDHLLALVRRVAELTGGRVDAKVPLLDRPLPDGARIRAKVPPLAPQPTLTIEKSTGNPFVALKRQQAEKSRGEALPYNLLRERIQQRLLREFEGNTAATTGNPDRLRVQVEEMIGAVIAEEKVAVTRAERAALVMDLLNEIIGLGPIEPLLNDPDVDEVMVNGPYQIYVEKKGKLELSGQRFRDNAHVLQVIDRIVAPLGRRVDEKSPMVDGRLRDGSRFNAVIPPLALSGPTMTIRKFARDPFTMTDLINFGSLTRESAQFLQAAVEGRLNIIVSGGTGSGKTTTLNVLSSFIPSTERIVTIEDAAELQMRQEHVIRMETRPANIEGIGEVSIRDLVRNSLRMRPDRIVVGECRGGEALDMLQAMNTGHDGSLTTAHSNGPRDTLKRLEIMVMMAGFDLPIKAIREQCAMAIQLIVHQERMRDGKRRVTAITEIVGMEGDVITMQDIFRFEQDRVDEDGRVIGQLAATGLRPKNFEVITDNGVELSMDLFHPRVPEGPQRGRLGGR